MTTVLTQTQSQDIKLYHGDATTVRCTVKSYSTGQVVDLTNYTALFTVKRQPYDDDADAVFQITGTIASPTTGVCTFAILKAQTTQFVGDYYYDIEVYETSPSADTKTVLAGKFTIIWDVSRTG